MSDASRLVPAAVVARVAARSRWSVGFGPRFFVVLLVGLVWIGPAWFTPRFLYAMAFWDVLALCVWAWDLSRLPRTRQLELRRCWQATPALDTTSGVELELVNSGRTGVLAIAVDDVPVALRESPAEVELRAGAGRTGRGAYTIRPSQRGDTRCGAVFLRYQSALRMAERWGVAEIAQTMRVYPNLEEAKRHTVFLIRSRQVEMEKRRKRLRGLGREFESLREYQPGDEPRDICWTATARRGHMVTKVFQIERSQPVWIVLDAGRLLRARVQGPSKLDHAVNAALSLAQVALYSGDRVGLLAYGRRLQQRVAAGRGRTQLRLLVERLALVHAEAHEADHLQAAQDLLAVQKRRALVVWLTDLAETPATPEVVEGALQITPRHLVLFGVISQPELGELAQRVPENETEMYRHVAALDMVHRRELLLRRLRQHGVLALEFAPGHISTALVNQYLEIKERNLL